MTLCRESITKKESCQQLYDLGFRVSSPQYNTKMYFIQLVIINESRKHMEIHW